VKAREKKWQWGRDELKEPSSYIFTTKINIINNQE
jgi:hypothetical protein